MDLSPTLDGEMGEGEKLQGLAPSPQTLSLEPLRVRSHRFAALAVILANPVSGPGQAPESRTDLGSPVSSTGQVCRVRHDMRHPTTCSGGVHPSRPALEGEGLTPITVPTKVLLRVLKRALVMLFKSKR